MWMIENHTPFSAERVWVRDRTGAEVWVVAVKGTFTINPNGFATLAKKQETISLVPQYRGEPGKSSLLYESDLVHTKPTTDVILHGHAYAPFGKRAKHVDVRLRVAGIIKTLRVFGDRYWDRGLVALRKTNPEPFEKMPVIYERAYGGIDQKSGDPQKHGWERRNPVGTGFAVEANHLIGQKLPNIEYPEELISGWKDRPRPAGFGPIAGDWSPRIQQAGTYDDNWKKERYPLFPSDFNERFYLCAPEDQQAPTYLAGGETVELYNLTPRGLLRFNIPTVLLDFTTHFFTGESIEHHAVLHSIILEPDIPRAIVVWHTDLPCHTKGLKLERTVIRHLRPAIAYDT
jgi:hypothetical protein